MRALVVDDDPVLRLAVAQFVERIGFVADVAEDGGMALERFKAQPPDIVLLDAAMPEVDGFEACAAIRALPEGAHVPIIMITVYHDEESVDKAFEAGADEFITKPIHWAVLRNRALYLVTAYRAQRQLRDDHAFFQSLVDSIPDPTVVVDCDLQVRWLNHAARGFFMLEAVELGKPLALAVDAVLRDGKQQPAADVLDEILGLSAPEEAEPTVLMRSDAQDRHWFAQLILRVLRGDLGEPHGFILRLQDVTERERERERLQREAHTQGDLARQDSLTGLANRRRFEEELRALLRQRRDAPRKRLALLFMDLDGFKAINDSHGHGAGDELLRRIGGRLQGLVRHSDLVARIGGDEFGVLLPEAQDESSILQLAERLLESVREPVRLAGVNCVVSASIGVAVFPDHALDAERLLKAADTAMYAVKHSGKSGVRFAHSSG
jgi:diguanylate cyclase (GGDEF)-like protein